MKGLSILILAAGNASRMGSVKQLLPYKNSTLLGNAIKSALQSKADTVYCVLGANSERIQNEIIEPQVTFIINKGWQSGLSSSIVRGITYLQRLKEEPKAVLVMLADQPNIDANYLNILIKLHEKNNEIVASVYNKTKGVPAIFPSTVFKSLLEIKGDKGAKLFLNNTSFTVLHLDMESTSVLKDIDTPEDYKALM